MILYRAQQRKTEEEVFLTESAVGPRKYYWDIIEDKGYQGMNEFLNGIISIEKPFIGRLNWLMNPKIFKSRPTG